MAYALLALALTLNALANLLLKTGAQELGGLSQPQLLQRALANPYLLAGVALFAVNLVLYAAALTRLSLSVAYPVMVSGGLLLVVLGSALWLRETVTPLQWMGVALLAMGIVLVTWRPAT